MNKRGFTLIELLAVIVILAIIALIATPIVLNIISDSKKSTMPRSAEMYLNAVEYGIADTIMNNKIISNETHKVMSTGNICIGTYSNKTCEGDIIEVEVNGEVPKEGSTIIVEEGKIKGVKLLYGDNIIIKDINGNLVYEKKFNDICTYQNNGVAEKTAGAKYTCEVKDGINYNFYVLTTPEEGDTTINLIMDRNIYYDGITGSETTNTNIGTIAWISDSNYGCGNDGDKCAINDKGPVTAMTYLYNATKDWINISPVNYTYMDRQVQGNADGEGYTSFLSTNGVATITPVTGDGVTIGSESIPLRARMPIYSSDATITEVKSKSNASYLYDNLDPEAKKAPYGYWTLSSNAVYYTYAWKVNYSGLVNERNVFDDGRYGVRPVITLKL